MSISRIKKAFLWLSGFSCSHCLTSDQKPLNLRIITRLRESDVMVAFNFG
ncbi:unnamed protein product [Acanthoscelides obtectus]|uniref:Uncharacterized protein n=1 Tax=Acanthoscelides obtectus TaxID=200917 RepID=A0A9P0KGI3_ACAOB|nr:unnamed protein product [Acanthoscelides obtectus]CAK1632546.1 hypothetical protein AOBTE_LOCUS7617 [Acanthoscelides obtectus]